MSNLNLNRITFFTAVVEAGSFTAAGERLDVSKAVVSHQVSKLEEELGTSLIVRTTRRLQTTEQGRRFYERCSALLRDAENAFDEVTLASGEPTGCLRLTAPIDYGAVVVAPAIATYLQKYPQMQVDMVFDDDVLDLLADNVDLSIRVGWLDDSSHQARRVGSFQQHLVCAPGLLTQQGLDIQSLTPQTIETFPWVANGALKEPLRWAFTHGDGEPVVVQGKGAVVTDKTPTAHACALAGVGLSVFPDFLVAPDIAAGRLVRLLPDWTLPSGGIYAVYPATRFRPAKVRAFVDILLTGERLRVGAQA